MKVNEILVENQNYLTEVDYKSLFKGLKHSVALLGHALTIGAWGIMGVLGYSIITDTPNSQKTTTIPKVAPADPKSVVYQMVNDATIIAFSSRRLNLSRSSVIEKFKDLGYKDEALSVAIYITNIAYSFPVGHLTKDEFQNLIMKEIGPQIELQFARSKEK